MPPWVLMSNLIESELINDALRLDELGRSIAKACIEWDPTKLGVLIEEFFQAKNRISASVIAHPVVQLPGTSNAKAREIVMRVAARQSLPIEESLLARLVDCELDEEQLEEIGTEELYSWMSHVDYARGLYKAGALVVGCGSIPDGLRTFVGEARQCFAFQQYNSVCALCRTMIELSVKDIATAYGVLPADRDNITHLASRGQIPLSKLIGELTTIPAFRHLRDDLHQVRIATNAIVHGSRSVDEPEAAATLKQTLDAIHRIYEAHGLAA